MIPMRMPDWKRERASYDRGRVDALRRFADDMEHAATYTDVPVEVVVEEARGRASAIERGV